MAVPANRAPDGRELRSQGRRTMAALLEAGMQVLAERGYHAARVDDVVRVADVSHGTFYLYFANKEDLFRALAERVASEMRDLAADLPPLGDDAAGVEGLRAWLARFADLYARYGPVIRAWTEAEIGGSEFRRLGAGVLTDFSRVFAQRLIGAAPPGVDPAVAALAVVAMIERANYYVLSGQVRVTSGAMVDTLAAVTHAALFGAAVPAPTGMTNRG